MIKELLSAIPWMDGLVRREDYPYGLWVVKQPAASDPLIFRFPPPLHPIEWVAAVSHGFGGTDVNGESVKDLIVERSKDFYPYTKTLADSCGWRVKEVRLLWHVCTPLTVPFPNNMWDAEVLRSCVKAVWGAAGHAYEDWIEALVKARDPKKMRADFWTTGLAG